MGRGAAFRHIKLQPQPPGAQHRSRAVCRQARQGFHQAVALVGGRVAQFALDQLGRCGIELGQFTGTRRVLSWLTRTRRTAAPISEGALSIGELSQAPLSGGRPFACIIDRSRFWRALSRRERVAHSGR
jgi:hypothetical protein